jgi:hypothetical protein
VNPKNAFDAAIQRPEHLLRLYELLHDTRQRSVRSDWANGFRQLMHWPAAEEFVRVDGKDRDSMLIMRESVGVDRGHFTHGYLSELLRSALVAAVSALDRFCHDAIVHHSWKLLSRKERDIPKGLFRLNLPVLGTKKALEKLRKDSKSRPGSVVKVAIQEELHNKHTFQNPAGIETAARMLGIEDVWTKLAAEMPGRTGKAIRDTLDEIARRRNQVVHEADLIRRTRSGSVTLRDIQYSECEQWVLFIKDFVAAIDTVVLAAM